MKSLIMPVIVSLGIIYGFGLFGFFGITKLVNLMTINSQGWSLIFSIGTILIIFLI